MVKTNAFIKISVPKDARYAADLDPLEPNDSRYVPLADVRQDRVPVDLYRAMKGAVDHPKRKAAHLCYAGHRGNGKTTELFMVMEKLEKEAPFHFVYQAADADLATEELDYTDIMLYLAKTALEGMPEGLEVDEAHLKTIEKWFTERVITAQDFKESQLEVTAKAEMGFSIPGLLTLLSGLTSSIKGGHKSAMETRHVLRRQVSDLIARMNELFRALREALKKAEKPHELTLVLDNLDRLPPDIMESAFS
ncbi:MAG: hypothetical protein GY757_16545, partial [bacterium]|nr:hypothetical protein [bacterium]